MNRGVFALFLRAIREDTRSKGTYLIRILFCAFTIAAIFVIKEQSRFLNSPGLTLFTFLCYINIAVISLGAFSIFANSITQEKEEGTLGLLRMTRLSPLAILLGKSASRLAQASLLLITQVPFSFMAITLGGLSLDQILLSYLSLGAYLIFAAHLGLLMSVICARTRSAAGLTFLIMLFVHASPFLIEVVLSGPSQLTSSFWITVTEGTRDGLMAISPTKRLNEVLAGGGDRSIFSIQVVVNLLLGLATFIAAWLGFEVFNRDAKPAGPKRSILLKTNRNKPPRRSWNNALAWKDFTFITGGMPMFRVKLLVYGVITLLCVYVCFFRVKTPQSASLLGEILLGIFLFIAFIEATLYSSRIFQQERKWNTLSSIALLPRSLSTLAYNKVAGTALALIPALLFVLISAALNPSNFGSFLKQAFTKAPGIFSLTIIIFFFHLIAYLSLRLKWSAIPAAILVMIALYLFFGLILFIIFRGSRSQEFHALCVVETITFFLLATSLLKTLTGWSLRRSFAMPILLSIGLYFLLQYFAVQGDPYGSYYYRSRRHEEATALFTAAGLVLLLTAHVHILTGRRFAYSVTES